MSDASREFIWVNSADDHIYEPPDLWQQAGLSPENLALAPYTRVEDDRQVYYCEGREVWRTPMTMAQAITPPGSLDLRMRLKDLDGQGVWASLAFPSYALWTTNMTHREAATACVRAYNDWVAAEVNTVSPRMVGAALLPLLDIADTVAEAKRAAEKGFKALIAPTTLPEGMDYNQPMWEPLWALAEEAGLRLCFHIGTGPQSKIMARGPGGAVINYCETAFPAQRTICHLVASGALDRHPKLIVMVAEGGCSWIPALVDRMEEGYRQHAMFVRPKLARDIKEIVYSQVYASFQHDKSALPIMQATGFENVMWGCDYPHLEGTFPNTQRVLHEIFDGAPLAVRRKVTIDNFRKLFDVPLPQSLAA
jgi:predicted TIM-barrel fold metal-dependent hydrolase